MFQVAPVMISTH